MLFTAFSGTGFLEFVSLMDWLGFLHGGVAVDFSCGFLGADFWVRILGCGFVMACAEFGVRMFFCGFFGMLSHRKRPEKIPSKNPSDKS